MTRDSRLADVSLVVFDMDGTLTRSGLDFDAIRREADIPPGRPVLEYVSVLDAEQAARVHEILDRHELAEAASCELAPAAPEVLARLRARGLKTAILSRNSRRACRTVVERFSLAPDAVVAREDAPPKPSAEAVLAVCRACGAGPGETLVVGDYLFDIQAGHAAGALTALLRNAKMAGVPCPADFVLDSLREVPELLGA
jgi:HAD superfamily hydrolase (TIGR01509 family)